VTTWSVYRSVAPAQLFAAGLLLPITIRTFDLRPRIKSIHIVNNVNNIAVSAFLSASVSSSSDITLGPQQYMTMPVSQSDVVTFLFTITQGLAPNGGFIFLLATEADLTAAAGFTG
jgi:hypothetical protein